MSRSTKILSASCALFLFACPAKDDEKKGPKAPPPTGTPMTRDDAAAEGSADKDSSTSGGDLGYGDDARLFDTPAQAMRAIMEVKPQIIGFGEYHKLATSPKVQSALRRFADEMLDVVGPQTAHLVLETWSVDPRCGKQGEEVTRKVEEAIQRPREIENEMQTLMRKSAEHGIRGSVLRFSCDEYEALLGSSNVKGEGKGKGKGKASLNAEALLESVSRKLGEQALQAWKSENAGKGSDKMVLLYGGATHNNLSPYPGLEAWSYPQKLAKESKARFVEVDLYVPELVRDDAVLSQEPWWPLMKEARTNKVILIRRDPTSYIILMRKGYADLAEGRPAKSARRK